MNNCLITQKLRPQGTRWVNRTHFWIRYDCHCHTDSFCWADGCLVDRGTGSQGVFLQRSCYMLSSVQILCVDMVCRRKSHRQDQISQKFQLSGQWPVALNLMQVSYKNSQSKLPLGCLFHCVEFYCVVINSRQWCCKRYIIPICWRGRLRREYAYGKLL